jgi:hypothetical protein
MMNEPNQPIQPMADELALGTSRKMVGGSTGIRRDMMRTSLEADQLLQELDHWDQSTINDPIFANH